MSDPYSELSAILTIILRFEVPNSNDTYRFAPVQALKTATDLYAEKQDKATFIALVKAIKAMRPYIKRGIDFNHIRICLDELAQYHQLPPINWQGGTKSIHANLAIHITEKGVNANLIPWLNTISHQNKSFETLSKFEQAKTLNDCCNNQYGFTVKFKNYLADNPDYLVDLALNSESTFQIVAKSRLSLFLDDVQIAKIMEKHWLRSTPMDYNKVDQILETMSVTLSYGRTIEKLLENPEVQNHLKDSPFLKVYQSEEYQQHHQANTHKPSR